MRKIKIYIFFYLCVIFTGFAFFNTSCSGNTGALKIPFFSKDNMLSDVGKMEVFILNEGKADAIILTTKNHTVMIDTGEDKDGKKIVNYLSEHSITTIDYLIITHFHKDHVGGAEKIIKKLDVKEIIIPDYGKDSKQYEKFLIAANKARVKRNILKEKIEFALDGVTFTIYPSRQEYHYFSNEYKEDENDDQDYEDNNDGNDSDEENDRYDDIVNENNYSLVTKVSHGNHNFLFTGDAQSKRLKELLATGDITNVKYDFLKVPEHGRYNKRSTDFIHSIKPKYAVITCSSDEPADKRVVSALKRAGADIYLTINGNICCESDGSNLKISYK